MAGIYIHIPFCKQACLYCNFHFSVSLKQKTAFITALVKEINIAKDNTSCYEEKETISTLYFGGGTPSILNNDDLQIIFSALADSFIFAPDIEITIEANPDDISHEKLMQWKSHGINRLSVGIQSFFDEELQWMNRAHTAAESLLCIDTIKTAGFYNYSVDLIYGSPLLTNDNWKKNVDTILERNIPHISCYALTVEPKTPLNVLIQQKKKQPVDAERQAAQFLLLMEWMEKAGYEHYEISNFSRPGSRSKHNSSYWQGKKYYGFGPSAHSFDGDRIRRWNISNNSLYIQSLLKNTIPFEEEILTDTQRLNEYIMTSLRTIEGIDLQYIVSAFGAEYSEKLKTAASGYIATHKLDAKYNSIILTREGKLFADGIAGDLFF